MKKLLTVTAMTLAAIGLATTAASAATVSAGATDLILGFATDDSTTPGNASNLEIDLGPIASLTSESFSNIGADLSTVYGSGWASRTDIVWGAGGVLSTSPSNKSVVVTLNDGLPSGASSTSLSPAWNAIKTLAIGLNGQTALSESNAASVSTSLGNSFTQALAGAGTTTLLNYSGSDYGGYFGTLETVLQDNVDTTTPLGSIELYEMNGTNSTSTDLGTLKLIGSGSSATLSFTALATPEPSSYALALGGLAFLVWAMRRKSVA
ncbi:MAG: hypothetical protein LV480_01865 [Methylacidiphilales bacterium]|nr:hypothetical protein [Candidatus Methylacidiphilales bacterium]